MKLKVLILFFAISIPFSIEAQLDNMALLEGLTKGLTDFDAPSMKEEDESFEENEDELEEKRKRAAAPNYADETYGYTGNQSFVNPPQSRFFKDPLVHFGYDFFIYAPSTYAQTKDIPIPPDYVLGPGDNLKIMTFGGSNDQFTLKINRTGDIFYPGLGPIGIAGQNFSDAKNLIEMRVKNQMIGTNVSISLGKLRSVNVFVVGEAITPGSYNISSLSTLTNAIFASGGISKTGSLRNIQLKRNGKIVTSFDFYDLLLSGDTTKDKKIQSGDVVFIPPKSKTIGIAGEVSRPGIYELKEGETLNDIIRFSGNLKPKADTRTAEIQRISSSTNGFNLIRVKEVNNQLEDIWLNNGDVVNIYPVYDNIKNAVLVSGHAQKPGFYSWFKGMRLNDIIKSSNDLMSMTDLRYVIIKRQNDINQNFEFLQADLEQIFKKPDSIENITLEEKDEIIFLPSLLTKDQITTKLILDKYNKNKNNQLMLENEWNSITFLRKSMLETPGKASDQIMLPNPLTGVEETSDIRRYYEYTVYDYCTLTPNFVLDLVSDSVNRSNDSIPLEELENITNPMELQNIMSNKQDNSDDVDEYNTEFSKSLTTNCRNQLLAPIIEVVNRQNNSNKKKKIVSVFGNVHFPGEYPLTKGMILEDAIKAAGGLQDATYDSEIELSRGNIVGKMLSVSNSFAALSDVEQMNTKLQEIDVINLKQISTDIKTVEITGEVYFPGVYPISENQSLRELVERAGGVTDFGSMQAAYFQRQSLKEAEKERLSGAKEELKRKILLSSQSGGLGENSLDANAITQLTSLILSDTKDEETALGRLVIDLDSIIEGSIEDIILEDGDSLFIPKKRQTISVIGEVYVSNAHLYKERLSIDDYLDLSGGATPFADKGAAYLIKSDGSIVSPNQLSSSGFFRGSNQNLEPGDTIVVPLEIQPFSGVRATTEITQIIYQMALAAAAVNSF